MDLEEAIKLLKEMQENCKSKKAYKDEKAEAKAEAIEVVLNLIEKLQKEKDEILNSKVGVDLSFDDYIPKDKIRKLLENNYDISTENSRSISVEGAFAFVDDIEELLEEAN